MPYKKNSLETYIAENDFLVVAVSLSKVKNTKNMNVAINTLEIKRIIGKEEAQN